MDSSTPASIETNAGQSESSSKKRRPTEKRKLQNRIAQRKYRENLKNRLENLERQANEISEQRNAAAAPDAGTTSQPEAVDPLPAGLDENSFEFLLNMDSEDPISQIFPPDPGSFEVLGFPLLPDLDSSFGAPPEIESSAPTESSNPSAPTALDVEFEYDFYINQLSEESSSPPQHLNQFSQVNENPPHTPWVPSRSWPDSGNSPAKTMDNFVRLVPDALTVSKMTIKAPKGPNKLHSYLNPATTFASGLVHQLRLDDSKENQSLVRTAIARGYNIRDVFLAGLSALDKRDSLQPRTGFDPHINTLTLVPTSTLQAYLSNAMAMKLPVAGLKNEEFQSPFYQPEAFASGNMAALEAIWNGLPKSLRPTRGQITIPHHPWMDMIPFPTLRDRALTLSTLDPPMINIYDFKNDVFMNSGLFCWKVGGNGGTGQPWDMRSWEAEPWFLKKWWILVGGETGDIWEQTHWWRAMRGKPKVEIDGAAK